MEGLTFSIVLFYIFLFLPSTHNLLADSSRLLHTDTHTHTLSLTHTHAIYCTFSPRNYILQCVLVNCSFLYLLFSSNTPFTLSTFLILLLGTGHTKGQGTDKYE